MTDATSPPILLLLSIIIGTIPVCIIFVIWLRRSGASLGQQSIETITRSASSDQSDSTDLSTIQVRTHPTLVWAMRLLYSFATLGYMACLFNHLWLLGFMGITLFGAIAVWCLANNGIIYEADKVGIKEISFLPKRQVSWNQVARCDVVTLHNVYGRFVRRFPIFYDEAGNRLFTSSGLFAPQDSVDQLIAFVRARINPD